MKKIAVMIMICVIAGMIPLAGDNWNEDIPQLSLHPFYTESELVFLPELMGTWIDNGRDKDFLKFETVDGKSYVLTIGLGDVRRVLEAHLLRLKEELFLDVYFSEEVWKEMGGESEGQPAIPSLHAFGRIRIEGDKLQFSTLHENCSSCKDEDLEENKTAYGLPGALIEDGLVLSATTEQLQEFVLQHIEEYFSFKEDDFLRRVLPPEGEESEIDGAESETNCTILRDKEEIR